jgi:hypothetical protein
MIRPSLGMAATEQRRGLDMQIPTIQSRIDFFRIGVLFILLPLGPATYATVYKCTKQDGSTAYPERRYIDYLAEHGELLTERAFALLDLGLWDEGVAELKEAAGEFEHDRDNVGAAIHLAEVECDLARPADARSVLAQITAGLSPYGEMRVEGVRLDVAAQEGDAAQVERSLSYLRAHRDEAPVSYLTALIVADQPDGAAEELRRQLLDPATRLNALRNVQTFAPEQATPRDLEMRARWQSVLARPDVQNTITRVGRVQSYDMEGSLF